MKNLKHLKTFESFSHDSEPHNDMSNDLNSQIVDVLQQNGFVNWSLENNTAEDKHGRMVKITRVLHKHASVLLDEYNDSLQVGLPARRPPFTHEAEPKHSNNIKVDVAAVLKQNGFVNWSLESNNVEDKHGRMIKITRVLQKHAPELVAPYNDSLQDKLPNFGQPGTLLIVIKQLLAQHGYEVFDYEGDVANHIDTNEKCTISELLRQYKPALLHPFKNSDMRMGSPRYR
jgi:ribosomal protein S8